MKIKTTCTLMKTLALTLALLAFNTAAARAASHTAQSALFTGDSRDYTLSVVSTHGSPVPTVGLHAYAWRSAVTASVDVSSSGYDCTGWSGVGSVPATGATTTTGEITLNEVESSITWQWAANSYEVAFDAQGGVAPIPATKNVTYNEAYGTLATTSRAGYTFAGWWTEVGGTGMEITNASVMITADAHMLYAKWTANQYELTFDAQGGAEPNPVTKNVVYDADYGTLATTTRVGYTFGGWWTAADGDGTQVTAATKVATANLHTLYAKWTANSYRVSYHVQGGVALNPGFMGVLFDDDYGTLELATRVGYTFGGWWTAADGNGTHVTDTTKVATAADHTLYAKWTANQYALTFDSMGGTAIAPITQDYGTDVTAPAAPTRTGYTFAGWNPTVPASMPVGGLTLTAQWTADVYTVTFDAQGGEVNSTNKVVTFNAAYGELPDPARTGYTFTGWQTATNDITFGVTSNTVVLISDDHTLDATWTANSYTVAFDAQGGTAPAPATIDFTYDAAYGTLATTTRAGYTFAGWWTGAAGTGTEVTAATVTAEADDHALYAQWTVNQYTLSFDSAGGTAVAPITQDYDTTVTAPTAPARRGYTFASWSPTVPTTMPAESLTLTAQWTANDYTVTFDAQDGEAPSPATIEVVYDAAYGTLATTTRAGYTFAGWWTEVGGTGIEITAATVVTTVTNHTLYAYWIGELVPVHRFWSDQFGAHFYIMGDSERDRIDAKYPGIWNYEAVAWYAYSVQAIGTEPVHRFWSDVLGKHFYIMGDSERDRIAAKYKGIWNYEAVAWYAHPTQVEGSDPVGRFWSDQFMGHFYIITQPEIDRITGKYPGIWNYEAVAYYAFTSLPEGRGNKSFASVAQMDSNEGASEKIQDERRMVINTASIVQGDGLPDFDVVYPLAYSDCHVTAQVYDSITEQWTSVLAATNSPDSVVLESVKPDRSYLVEVFANDSADGELKSVYRSWFDYQLDPPETISGEDSSESISDSGRMPVIRLKTPSGDETLTVKLYSSKFGVVQTLIDVSGGDTVELPLPEWNRWYWVGGWQDSDNALVMSLWMRIEAED